MWLSGLRGKREEGERGREGKGVSVPPCLSPSQKDSVMGKSIQMGSQVNRHCRRLTSERGESGNGGHRRRPPLWAECPHLFEWGGITHAETADRHLLGHCPYWEGGGGIGEEMGHVMVGYAFSDDAHSWSDIVLRMEDTKLRGWVYWHKSPHPPSNMFIPNTVCA